MNQFVRRTRPTRPSSTVATVLPWAMYTGIRGGRVLSRWCKKASKGSTAVGDFPSLIRPSIPRTTGSAPARCTATANSSARGPCHTRSSWTIRRWLASLAGAAVVASKGVWMIRTSPGATGRVVRRPRPRAVPVSKSSTPQHASGSMADPGATAPSCSWGARRSARYLSTAARTSCPSFSGTPARARSARSGCPSRARALARRRLALS
mmetsp:Transcript_86978/g.233008  ORF Transcript_86978/g.233008 Transcript_86978/m.233008 type:complete len:208 (-) Transcript_86978:106-729(-)